jgi:hypothetical protein
MSDPRAQKGSGLGKMRTRSLGGVSGLKWEKLRTDSRKERGHTYLLCSINNLCEGKREKQRPGKVHVIHHVYS